MEIYGNSKFNDKDFSRIKQRDFQIMKKENFPSVI